MFSGAVDVGSSVKVASIQKMARTKNPPPADRGGKNRLTVTHGDLGVPGKRFLDFLRWERDPATKNLALVFTMSLSLPELLGDELPSFRGQVFAESPLLELEF
jgi:hypothetical protein